MAEVACFPTSAAPDGSLPVIRRLLQDTFGGAFSDDDWDHTLGGVHVTVSSGGVVVAHAAVVARTIEVGGRALRTGYVEGVATAPDRQGEGLGSLAVATVSDLVRDGYEMGALSTGRPGFYERLGWERWAGPSYVRCGRDLVRSEDDDDGLLVLRFGPSAGVDLRAPIVCEARTGDAW